MTDEHETDLEKKKELWKGIRRARIRARGWESVMGIIAIYTLGHLLNYWDKTGIAMWIAVSALVTMIVVEVVFRVR